MASEINEIVRLMYQHFNDRNISEMVKLIGSKTEWSNGEGYCVGQAAIRAFWENYCKIGNVYTYPIRMKSSHQSTYWEVEAIRFIRDEHGNNIQQGVVHHYFLVKDQLIRRFDLDKSWSPPQQHPPVNSIEIPT